MKPSKKRIDTMRRTQRVALDLFEQRGFDHVAVADVASAAGVAASTIYRHFSTKEGLVMWDEHDGETSDALVRHLGEGQRPVEAIQSAFVEALAARYDESDFQLRRVRYIYATEQVHAAAIEADLVNRDELAEGLAHFLPEAQRPAAPVIAGATLAALDVAIGNWQQANGMRTLAECIAEAFSYLSRL